jgi:hypothetical protein
MNWNTVRSEIREILLLEHAEQNSAKLTEGQRMTARAFAEAANSRLTVARDIRGTSQTPVALDLYRAGSFFYTLAVLAAKEQSLDVAALTPDAAYRKLDEVLEHDGTNPPGEFARVKPFLLSTDPLGADRMPADRTDQSAQELERTTRWLSRLFDIRSPKELRAARVLRVSGVAAALLALLVMVGVWLFSPKDIAKGRPATSSGPPQYSTTPAGAVDGSTSGQFGFHSALEDNPWLAVDLGRRYAIERVKVYGRGDGPFDQSVPLALEVSDDGTTYKQVAERTEAFSVADPWIVKPQGLVAQFVRVHTLRHSFLVLGEVEVYGHPAK